MKRIAVAAAALAVVATAVTVAVALRDRPRPKGPPAAAAALRPRPAPTASIDPLPSARAQDQDDPPGALRLEGQVVDGDERPVAGAVVAIDTVPPRDLRTEEDGSFSFDGLVARTFRVEARGDDGIAGPVRVHLDAAAEPVVLRLAPAAALEVHVVDAATSAPIADAVVELRTVAAVTTSTGADGVARLAGVGGGWHAIKVSAPGFASAFQEVTSTGAPGAVTRVELRLRAGVAVGGTVVDAAGRPVEGARVLAEAASASDLSDPRRDAVLSDVKGRWRLAGLPRGSVRFRASHASYAPASTAPIVLAGDRDDVVIGLSPGARLAGVVVGAGGRPVAGAQVLIGAGNVQAGLVRRAACDAAGRFDVSGLPRQVLIVAARDDRASSRLAKVDLGGRAERTDLVLTLDGDATITGRVVTATGAAVPEARIEAVPALRDDNLGRAERRLRGPASAIADGDGRFTLAALVPGAYRVRAIRPGAPSDLLEMRQGQLAETGHDVTITVDDLTALTGKVVIAGDGPAPAFAVTIGGAPARAFTGGEFRIEGVPVGRQFLAVEGIDFTAIHRDVDVVAGEVTDLGTLEVDRGRTVSGRVLGPGGRPVAGAAVIVAAELNADGTSLLPFPDSGRHVHQVTSGADGSYRVRGVRAGSTFIVAEDDSGRSTPRDLPPGPGDLRLDLVLAPFGTVEGRIRIDGVPGEAVASMRGQGAADVMQEVVSGPDGVFRLDRVAAGGYVLYASLPRGDRLGGGGGAGRPITVTAGEVTRADMDLTRGAIALTVQIVSPHDAVAYAYAVVVRTKGTMDRLPATVSEARALLATLGDVELKEGFVVQDRRIVFDGVAPGAYGACAVPLAGDPSDPQVLAAISSSIVDQPIYCVRATVAPSPAAQMIKVALPAPKTSPTP